MKITKFSIGWKQNYSKYPVVELFLKILSFLSQIYMDNSIELTQIGRYDSGIFDEGAAEITAYDPGSQQLFVINGATSTIDILDVSDPTNPTFVKAIALANSIGLNLSLTEPAFQTA